nr:LINE-type retrotransposon LIb DNA [Ipomoea batatas]
MDHFQEFKITHVMREGNQCADLLANLGQESPQGTIILDNPPERLSDLLARDAHSFAVCRRR